MTASPAQCSFWDERQVKAMGSRATLIVGDPPTGTVDWAIGRLADLEQTWSRFRPDSELSELNRSAGRWFPMSETLAAAIDRAWVLCALTGGRFDPTVLPSLVHLGYDRTFPRLDSRPPVLDRLIAPGIEDIEREREWIRLPAGIEIDLGGIGKGLAADMVATGLIERGATSVCVSMGGDLRVAGAAPDGGWMIPIADPRRHGATLGKVRVADGAIVTSTTAYRRWTRDDVEFHHIIDPSTGDSARGGVAAAVVLADEAWRAEGIAKAAVIAGADLGVEHIESCRASGWLITDDGMIRATKDAPPIMTSPNCDEGV